MVPCEQTDKEVSIMKGHTKTMGFCSQSQKLEESYISLSVKKR